jgi:site-specific DNA recombinase
MEVDMEPKMFLDNEHFRAFVEMVRAGLERLRPQVPDRESALNSEKDLLEARATGLLQSLGNASLPITVRRAVEVEFENIQNRVQSIARELSELAIHDTVCRKAVEPIRIAELLAGLATVLGGQNVSAGNLMLAQHIDAIVCPMEGPIVIRTCKLGALAGDLELFRRVDDGDTGSESSNLSLPRAAPRRRACLNTGDAMDPDIAAAANQFAGDPHRFAGLGSEWFNEDAYEVPPRLSWAERYAERVAQYRLQERASMGKTASHFGKSVPTIRAALKHAKESLGIDAFGKSVSERELPNWARSNAAAVARFFVNESATIAAAVAHFGRSAPTIRKALRFNGEASEGPAE